MSAIIADLNDALLTMISIIRCRNNYDFDDFGESWFGFRIGFQKLLMCVAIGPDDFGSQPFTYEPWEIIRIGYFNCVNPVSDDPRYVKVDMSRCSSGGHVYAVLEPDFYEFSVNDIEVGCYLMVATVWTPKQNVTYHKCDGKDTCDLREITFLERIPKLNSSYDEIRGLISEGIQLSWLPIICEDRCGRGPTVR
ncbi:hypothetical protein ACSQ67_000711 [Phaseolus vulgaris]